MSKSNKSEAKSNKAKPTFTVEKRPVKAKGPKPDYTRKAASPAQVQNHAVFFWKGETDGRFTILRDLTNDMTVKRIQAFSALSEPGSVMAMYIDGGGEWVRTDTMVKVGEGSDSWASFVHNADTRVFQLAEDSNLLRFLRNKARKANGVYLGPVRDSLEARAHLG